MLNHLKFNERPECQDTMIKMLMNMGYEYVSRSEAEIKRGSFSKIVFEDELIRFLKNQHFTFRGLRYNFSAESISRAIRELDASLLQGLMMASKEVYNSLINGISVEEKLIIDGDNLGIQSFDLNYIDFNNPSRNKWQVTEEFSVERTIMGGDGLDSRYARPDIILLCNGIPIVVIECKKSSVDVKEGVIQKVRNMTPNFIPNLFKYAQLVLAVNPNKVVYGTCCTSVDYFVEWKEQDIDWQQDMVKRYAVGGEMTMQNRITASLLDQRRLLEIINSFILYDCNIKKVARHQQYFAVNKAMDRILGKDGQDTRNGVIWHTQGSGKSLTMVMLVKKIMQTKEIANPRFIMVTDRVNLDKQIRDNFANTAMEPVRAKTGNGLKMLVKDNSNIIITTIINKFEKVVRSGVVAKDSENIFVFVDEAHRSNYSTMYNYMNDVLPLSTFIAFTGTPLLGNTSKNPKEKAMKKNSTYKQFGAPIDSYTMKRSIEDGITVPLVYEGRKVAQNVPNDIINGYLASLTADLPKNLQDDLKQKWSRFSKVAETSQRLNVIAFDVADHFREYCLPKKLKAILVCSSRLAAVEMHKIMLLQPDIKPAVIISFGDKPEGEGDNGSTEATNKITSYFNTYVKPRFGDSVEKYDDSMTDLFKSDSDEVNMLIVKDKLLTGFDAPNAGVLYVDKSIQQHTLLQAIARVNRVYRGKDFGLIVDYFGIFSKLNCAIDMYDDAEAGLHNFDRADIEDSIFGPIDEKNKLETAYRNLIEMFPNMKKSDSSNKWQLCLVDEKIRHEFYEKLSAFAKLLSLSLVNRAIYVEIGNKKIEDYRQEYLFYGKLKKAVSVRYGDSIDFSKYEDGIRNLLNTFVNAAEITTTVEPISITDVESMAKQIESMQSTHEKADYIKTKITSELKQKRYDDPLLFEEFSHKIRKTIDEYDKYRNADKYLQTMENMADDLRYNRSSVDYPIKIENDSESKAFYGAIVNKLKEKIDNIITLENENIIGDTAIQIKEKIKTNTKRDWRQNTVVHKQIRRELDDSIFDLFDLLLIDCNNKNNIKVLDLIIEEIMKVAIARY